MDWGALLAAVLLVGGRPATAGEPFRPGAFDETTALLGLWKTLEIDEHGALQPLGLKLKADGCFMLVVADAKGKVVNRVHGRFTYASGVLKLIVLEGSEYCEMAPRVPSPGTLTVEMTPLPELATASWPGSDSVRPPTEASAAS